MEKYYIMNRKQLIRLCESLFSQVECNIYNIQSIIEDFDILLTSPEELQSELKHIYYSLKTAKKWRNDYEDNTE